MKVTKLQQAQVAERLCSRQTEEQEEGGDCSSLPMSPLTREFHGVRMSGTVLSRMIKFNRIENLEWRKTPLTPQGL